MRQLVFAEQSSANDETAEILFWAKSVGEFVPAHHVICTVETSKAVYDIEARTDGYCFPLCQERSAVKIGEVIAVISSDPQDSEESIRRWLGSERSQTDSNQEKTWTAKAERLAKEFGLPIEDILPADGSRVTEDDVKAAIARQSIKKKVDDIFSYGTAPEFKSQKDFKKICILGAGAGATQIIDAIGDAARIAFIVDDREDLHGKELLGVKILGLSTNTFLKGRYEAGEIDSIVVSVNSTVKARSDVFERIKGLGIPLTNVVHESARIGANVTMGEGNVILALCLIGAFAIVGNNNYLSPYCSIEHHSKLGDSCSFGPGVITSSFVKIEDRVRFGTGIFIEPHLSIGHNAVIASSSCIVNNVPPNETIKVRK